MRLSLPLLAYTLCALSASASTLPASDEGTVSPTRSGLPDSDAAAIDEHCTFTLRGHAFDMCSQTRSTGAAALSAEEPTDEKDGTQRGETPPPNDDAKKAPDGESEFTSPPGPVGDGRRRAGAIAILAAIVLTIALAYLLYTYHMRLRTLLASLPALLQILPHPSFSSLKNLSMPAFASPHRARRRRRAKGGFRPHAARLRAWAAEDGVLDDAYERGLFADTESFSETDDPAEPGLDLGADEDFMIGAPRRGRGRGLGSARRENARRRAGAVCRGRCGRGRRDGRRPATRAEPTPVRQWAGQGLWERELIGGFVDTRLEVTFPVRFS
ncbi:hypothetical protein DFH11DRAFT_1730511 [Phellopilus nigrolimitatus]|nr:hypothetical protein DFH11DRAFT_1730511 [Phellopilus nigrolimitatus]